MVEWTNLRISPSVRPGFSLEIRRQQWSMSQIAPKRFADCEMLPDRPGKETGCKMGNCFLMLIALLTETSVVVSHALQVTRIVERSAKERR